jgi:hypothetical protein
MKIGILNARSKYKVGAWELLVAEVTTYKLDVAGLQPARLAENGGH